MTATIAGYSATGDAYVVATAALSRGAGSLRDAAGACQAVEHALAVPALPARAFGGTRAAPSIAAAAAAFGTLVEHHLLDLAKAIEKTADGLSRAASGYSDADQATAAAYAGVA